MTPFVEMCGLTAEEKVVLRSIILLMPARQAIPDIPDDQWLESCLKLIETGYIKIIFDGERFHLETDAVN